MSENSCESRDEIPNIPKIQYLRGRILWDYLKNNDPEFKKYGKKGSH